MGIILKRPSYVELYGLTEDPYNVLASEQFLYLKSSSHDNALALIDRVIDGRQGLALIIGEPGTGKTSLMRKVESALRDDPDYLINTVITTGGMSYFQFLDEVLAGFNIEARGQSRKVRADQLKQFLLDEYESGRTPILLVDEAQDLPAKVLEQIRGITNFEHPQSGRMLQIIFFAMPTIRKRLPYAKSLASRLKLSRASLEPMSQLETMDMLRWRFEVAGGRAFPLTSEVLSKIYYYSKGIPRESCGYTQLAFSALATGNLVTPETIDFIYQETQKNG